MSEEEKLCDVYLAFWLDVKNEPLVFICWLKVVLELKDQGELIC